MFKFFRQYNKLILVIGGCVLMVAFLVPQAVTMFGPQAMQRNAEIGTVHGEEITNAHANRAAFELDLLRGLPMAPALPTDDPTAWMLLQQDAAHLGLFASDREVEVAMQVMGLTPEQAGDLARQRNVKVEVVRDAIRRLLVAEQYRQLVTGTAFRDPGMAVPLAVDKVQTMQNVVQGQLAQFPEQMRQALAPQVIQMAMILADGTHRLSGPMLQHYVRDNYTNANGRVVLVPADPASADEPTPAELEEVFAQYRDSLPGRGMPYPFGYRYPDRVKLETLRLPMEAVREAVEVDYVEVLDAYRRQKARFVDEAGEAPETPAAEVAAQLTRELQRQRAEQLAGRIMAQVQSRLVQDQRGHPVEDGYIKLPENFEPVPFSELIAAVEAEHGVTLEVGRTGDLWVAVDELATLPGIGTASVGEGRPVPLTQIVQNTRQLAEQPELVPQSLRTQVGLGSTTLRGFNGDRYVFRLRDVEESHAPETLDEVREQVVQDARTIAAFEKLQQEATAWRERVLADGLDAAAAEAGLSVESTFPFQKVADNRGNPPSVNVVGPSRPFVDAAFALIEQLDDPTADIAQLPRERRTAVVPVNDSPQGPALALFVLDSYDPLTRSRYNQAVRGEAIFRANGSINQRVTQDPLSAEALAARTGFDLAVYNEER